MAEISATAVKDLREKTGAGMMDCKKALTESEGDMEKAVDWLRKKGLSAAAKKAGRIAAEGVIAVASAGTRAVMLEVNSETDFVARNAAFQDFALNTAKLALDEKLTIEALGAKTQETLTNLIATIGENLSLRRIASLEVGKGVIATYVHTPFAPNLGKIGVLVALESTGDAAKLQTLGKSLAMHIAAARPEALDIASVDQAAVQRERDILTDQAKSSGKPDDIIAKMVEGRLRKYYEDVVLLEQVYVVDGETRVASVVEKAAKEIGAPVKLTGFVRYQLGEGIEKAADDFAAEVAKMAV